jgi:hypothetical protein
VPNSEKQAGSAFLWDFTQRRMIIPYRRFGTTCRSLQGSASPKRAQVSFASRRKPEMTQKQAFVFYFCPTPNVYFESTCIPNFCILFVFTPHCCVGDLFLQNFGLHFFYDTCTVENIASEHSDQLKTFLSDTHTNTHTNWLSVFGSNVEWVSYIGRHDKCMTSVGRKTCQAETIWRACLLVGRYNNSRIMSGK